MILIIGVAGSGKSTQSKLLAAQEGMISLSVGELLRRTINSQEKKQKMLAGELLDDSEVIDSLDHEIEALSGKGEIILDGFPRSLIQAQWLVDKNNSKKFNISAVLCLEVDKENVKERLIQRARQDDTEESIKERFSEFDVTIQSILGLFSAHKIPIIEINAQQNPNAVHVEIMKKLADLGVISNDD
jgi:adenylate kinase